MKNERNEDDDDGMTLSLYVYEPYLTHRNTR